MRQLSWDQDLDTTVACKAPADSHYYSNRVPTTPQYMLVVYHQDALQFGW